MKTLPTFGKLRDALLESLGPIYGSYEAQNILRVYLEDRFGVRTLRPDEKLSREQELVFLQDLELFKEGMPVQYIVGKAFFYKHFFVVNQHVLIPRPETEELLVLALKRLRDFPENAARVLDIGTGSACIAISIVKEYSRVKMTAIDVSEDALELARANAGRLKAKVDFKVLDFLNEANWDLLCAFDLIVSNPPYISIKDYEELDPGVKEFEPKVALTPGGQDALIFYKRIFLFAQKHLSERGEVLMEFAYDQRPALKQLLDKQTFFSYAFHQDMQGKDRILHLRIK